MIHPALVRSLSFGGPGLSADYSRLGAGTGPSTTAGLAIGVAFTPQRHASWTVGGAARSGSFTPATVFVVPAEGIEWHEWTDVSESVEMWLDPELLAELSQLGGGPSRPSFDYHEVASDPVVVNVASLVRERMFSGDSPPAPMDSLALLLASHVLERYCGLRLPRAGRIRKLEPALLGRVTDYIDAHLGQPLGVLELARIAGRSPYHFAKAFKATTGSSPYSYIAARRMERALVLLQQTPLPVSHIARQVGFESLSHFRRSFRAAWGEPTSTYRRAGRPRRAA
jgi:AraC family transcriptional regulator